MEDNYPKYYSEEFREEFLEVDDSHILWEIDIRDEEDYHYFEFLCEQYIDELSNHYHTNFYRCGRSCRHLCIDDTPTNRRNFKHICRRVDTMQKELKKKMGEQENC